jgi:hypothetical protein
MSARVQAQVAAKATPAPAALPVRTGLVQRQCACGGAAGLTGECEECSKERRFGLQTKLKLSTPGDLHEQEADRIADQVMATPAHPALTGALPRIRRFAGPSKGETQVAPASVDQALATPGRPLEPALRRDMEQRFGHDFSRVRVHTGAAAEQSVQEVNAHAYTVGHDMVFGAGRFAPQTPQGRRLVAHELTHVVQQGGGSIPRTVDNPQSGMARGAQGLCGSITGNGSSGPSPLTTHQGGLAAGVHPSPAVVQRAPGDKGGMESVAVNLLYPEEEEVLQSATRVLEANVLAEGAVFYTGTTGAVGKDWNAIGISASAFIVGPFMSDMGQFLYVYRLKNSTGKQGTYTFSRGTYLGGWRGQLTPELREGLGRVAGGRDLHVKSTGSGFAEPRESLAFMMVIWKARGQLDPPNLPQGFGAIPQLPITQGQAKQLQANLSGPAAGLLMGGAVLGQGARTTAHAAIGTTGAGEIGATLARGTGSFEAVTEEAVGAAAEEETGTVVAGRAVGTARVGAAMAAAVTVLIWESSAPYGSFEEGISEITGGPYATRGEFGWETKLTTDQLRYVRDLWQQRYTSPSPVPIEMIQPIPTPTTQTPPESRRRRRRKCRDLAGPICPNRLTRLTTPNEYWNLAYNYRREHNLLGQYDFGQNIAVLQLEEGPPIIEINKDKLHSEQRIVWRLQNLRLGSDCPILGLFSERKPCQEICQKTVLPYLCQRNSNVPFDVCYAIEYYNSSEGIKTDNNRHELIKSYSDAGYYRMR